MNRDDAIRKIRALLNRAGRTEAEADTAQILAAALAEKAGLDLQQIDLTDPTRPPLVLVHREIAHWASKRPPEAFYASLIVQEYFDVTPLNVAGWDGERILFIGYPHHLDVAEYVFEFVLAEFRRAWNRRQSRTKARKAFVFGAYVALRDKLSNKRAKPYDAGSPLAVESSARAARLRYIREHFGETTSSEAQPKGTRTGATRAGWKAGQEIDIHSGLEGGDQSRADALPAPPGPQLALPSPL